MYDKITEELVEQMKVFKEIDVMHEKSGKAEMFKNIKYVEREVDEEIKAGFDREAERFAEMSSKLKNKVDGEISIDLHGNIAREGIQGTGTYVMRDGKLVEGKAEVRE